jgi:hypothetical protein
LQVNQPPLKHPPVFKLLTGFFGQSGEKFGLCAKKFGPSKMKFWGLLALKTSTKLVAGFLASTFVFSAFFVMRPNFRLDGTQRRTITGSLGYSATETATFVRNFRKLGDT